MRVVAPACPWDDACPRPFALIVKFFWKRKVIFLCYVQLHEKFEIASIGGSVSLFYCWTQSYHYLRISLCLFTRESLDATYKGVLLMWHAVIYMNIIWLIVMVNGMIVYWILDAIIWRIMSLALLNGVIGVHKVLVAWWKTWGIFSFLHNSDLNLGHD
jgi:hypothetical protein